MVANNLKTSLYGALERVAKAGDQIASQLNAHPPTYFDGASARFVPVAPTYDRFLPESIRADAAYAWRIVEQRNPKLLGGAAAAAGFKHELQDLWLSTLYFNNENNLRSSVTSIAERAGRLMGQLDLSFP